MKKAVWRAINESKNSNKHNYFEETQLVAG